MKIDLFDYQLSPELVAQFPTRQRDASRLMVLDRSEEAIEVYPFGQIFDYLRRGDLLVVNHTKVFKARLFGRRPTGGKVEVFLVRRFTEGSDTEWIALVHPSRRVKVGERVIFDDDHLTLGRDLGGGSWLVIFNSLSQWRRIIAQHGHVPLPHYIKRQDQSADLRRYQTVFARSDKVGAVAAPTAGFHFTKPILEKLTDMGVERAEICLHVGPGTFKPVTADQIEDHAVDPEMAEISPTSARMINRTRKRGGRIIAVGTTSVRTLEAAPVENGLIQAFSSMVDLYIRPGHEFRFVDAMITNFHLPKSSLLILVSAFAGREKVLAAYHQAIEKGLRFYSYGDAMLIV